MHILDTDTLSHLHTGNPNVIQNLSTLDDTTIGTTIITKIEMLRGRIDYLLKANTASDLLRAQQLFLLTESLLNQILIIPFDASAANRFEQLSIQK